MNIKKILYFQFIIYLLITSCSDKEEKFKEAENLNTIEAYQTFIDNYPKTELAQEAEKRIETMIYEKAMKENNKNALLEFIKNYPNSRFTLEANKILETIDYKSAIKENTEKSFIDFVTNYPPNFRHEHLGFRLVRQGPVVELK